MFLDIYTNHPSFRSTFIDLPYDPSLASELESIYHTLDSCGYGLSKKTLLAFEKRALGLLSQIFNTWITTAESEIHVKFLNDLHTESAFLVNEDFGKFKLRYENSYRFEISIDSSAKLSSLVQKGFFFDSLTHSEARSLKTLASTRIDEFVQNEKAGRCTREYLSANNGPSIRAIAGKLNQYLEKNGICNVVSAYLGYEVSLGGLALEMGSSKSTWWRSHYAVPPGTLYIHRDQSISLPKAFVYLNHISKGDGAFSVFPKASEIHGEPSWLQNLIGRRIGCIGNSPKHETYGKFKHIYHQPFGDPLFRGLFLSLPYQARYSSHYGWDILSNDAIHDQLLADELCLEGPPGSIIVFDGARVSHRALQHATSQHVSLQACFCPQKSLPAKIASKLTKHFIPSN